MKIELVDSPKYLFLNLVHEDGTIIQDTPIFTESDLKKVLQSYSLFIQSTVVYDSLELDESKAQNKDELMQALQSYSNIYGETSN